MLDHAFTEDSKRCFYYLVDLDNDRHTVVNVCDAHGSVTFDNVRGNARAVLYHTGQDGTNFVDGSRLRFTTRPHIDLLCLGIDFYTFSTDFGCCFATITGKYSEKHDIFCCNMLRVVFSYAYAFLYNICSSIRYAL